MLTLHALALVASTFISAASTDGPNLDYSRSVYLSSAAFTDVTMGSAREFDEIKTKGYSQLTLDFVFTRNAASAVTMTCKHARAAGGTFYNVHVLSYSTATAASDTHTWSNTVSGSENWSWTVQLLAGYNYVKCTLTATGGGASDLLTISATLR
jgi:hypothetical protein